MAMSRWTARILRVGVALAALAVGGAILVYMQRQAEVIANQGTYVYDGGVAYNRALAALHDAEYARNLGQWSECAELLGKAAAADQTIGEREGYKRLREAIAAKRAAEPAPIVVDHARALVELEKAGPLCELHFWSECCAQLMKAEAFDPALPVDPAFGPKYQPACREASESKAPDPVEDANRKRLGRPYPGPPLRPGSDSGT